MTIRTLWISDISREDYYGNLSLEELEKFKDILLFNYDKLSRFNPDNQKLLDDYISNEKEDRNNYFYPENEDYINPNKDNDYIDLSEEESSNKDLISHDFMLDTFLSEIEIIEDLIRIKIIENTNRPESREVNKFLEEMINGTSIIIQEDQIDDLWTKKIKITQYEREIDEFKKELDKKEKELSLINPNDFSDEMDLAIEFSLKLFEINSLSLKIKR